jgi:DNA-binding transcriptional MerR regulator
MSYTVHEVAKLSGVTIKTLYHYQKIELLMPKYIGENGYRYYGDKELEKLQEILFYRELDFSLNKIKEIMQNEPSRLQCLCEQKSLLMARQQRVSCILHTLDEAINYAKKGVTMNKEKMFSGLNKQEWEETLSEQSEYLKNEYDYDMLADEDIKPDELNKHSDQVTRFMFFMADSLKSGISPDDSRVKEAIKEHIDYVSKEIHPTDIKSFLKESEFFLKDDFHRNMYENIQTGLSYYIFVSAKMLAEDK